MSALIVARPGPLRVGLRAALETLPHLGYLGKVDNAVSALGVILNHEPALVLLCTDGPADGSFASFSRVAARWPAARFMTLVDTVDQQKAAQAAGLGKVLVKGVRPGRLLGTIEDLIRDENQAAAQ